MRFAFENASGERVDLSDTSSILLTDVYGLGFSNEDGTANLRSGFFTRLTTDNDSQVSCGGKLRFKGSDPYAQYIGLMNWLAQTSAVYLVYRPKDVEYSRSVMVRTVDKGDMATNTRTVDIDIAPLSPWYTAEPTTIILSTATANALVFDSTRFDQAVFVGSIYPGASAEVYGEGQISSAFRLTMRGAINDPVISVVGVESGKVHGRAEIIGTFDSDEGLVLDTTVDGSGVWKLESDGTLTDIIGSVNLYYDPFPRIPVTETCYLKVDSTGGAAGVADSTEAVIYRYYRTV